MTDDTTDGEAENRIHFGTTFVSESADTPSPEKLSERIERLFDETRDDDYERGLEDSGLLDDLGSTQKHVIVAIYKNSKPHPKGIDIGPDWYFDEEGPTWAEYSDVTKSTYYDGYRPKTKNALQAGVSRAVHRLCDRGLISGAYRTWSLKGTLSNGRTTHDTLGHGRKPWSTKFADERQPTFQYLQLTERGWNTAYSLIQVRLNNQ